MASAAMEIDNYTAMGFLDTAISHCQIACDIYYA